MAQGKSEDKTKTRGRYNLEEIVEAIRSGGSVSGAAKKLGCSPQNVRWRLQHADDAPPLAPRKAEEVVFPDLPSSELPAEQLIEQACARFNTHLAARDARRWFDIKIKSNKPIGVCFMGDPHVDNNGCNWPLLRDHIRILENTDGLFAVGIGDLTDNWTGRLVRLYADQEMSKKQAWKLAKYLLKEADIKWLVHLLGNHDSWGDGEYLIKANVTPVVPVCEWQARFQLVFPNSSTVRIHAAHDFPGSSIWNKMHGPLKASMLREQADIFACGHKHQWECVEGENAERAFIFWLIRSRGYKFLDNYADQLGYSSQRYGASITAIIDPQAEGPTRIRCFPDLQEAAEFLTWKRSRK